MKALATAVLLAFAGAGSAQGVFLSAEAFPPGAPVPGYCGIRIRTASELTPFEGTLRISSSGVVPIEYPWKLEANKITEVITAAYRVRESPIDISLGTASVRVDPGRPEPHLLVVGGLEEAEKASDLFGIPLTRIVRVPTFPYLFLHSAALDGFSGIVTNWGRPSPALQKDRTILGVFSSRGGTVVDLLSRKLLTNDHAETFAINAPARLALVVPPIGLCPIGFFGMSSAPVRVALAAAVLGIVAALLLVRGSRRSLGLGGAASIVSLGVLTAIPSPRWPRIEIEYSPDQCLKLEPFGDAGWGTAGSLGITYVTSDGISYPVGTTVGTTDSIGPPLIPPQATAGVLSEELIATPSDLPRPAPAIADPDSLPTVTLRTLAITAREIVGPNGSVELDRTEGRLVLRFPPTPRIR